MASKLTEEEMKVLYEIFQWRSNLEKFDGYLPKKKMVKVLKKLEKLGFIDADYKDGEIFYFILTKQGIKYLNGKMNGIGFEL